jgi:pseudaminic acid biosynthesis-associated methylase
MMTPQEQFWAGDFGSSYVERSRLSHLPRVPFWREVLDLTGAKWICEAGCNVGLNLKALRDADPDTILHGIDINEKAVLEAQQDGLLALKLPASALGAYYPQAFDLVFTAGVLIHIGGDDLSRVMDSLIAASRRYVLAVEYAADTEEEVPYRGHAERLWRRPFGSLYQAKGLRLVKEWDAGEGFDRCTAYLLLKEAA